MGAEQELFPQTRGPYQPKTATADLIVMPPYGLLRICRPVEARNTCSNCSAGGTRDKRLFMLSLPFRRFCAAWPVTIRWDQQKRISWKYWSPFLGRCNEKHLRRLGEPERKSANRNERNDIMLVLWYFLSTERYSFHCERLELSQQWQGTDRGHADRLLGRARV